MSSSREDRYIISETSSIRANIDKYPKDLRILAVDNNPVCLKLLSVVLKKCGYQFDAISDTVEAYKILKENKKNYDLVITDVKNNMNGFKFAQLIDMEMHIPVIIMSADDGRESVMNGIKYGAKNYLLKPVRYEELKIIWQHVARKELRLESTNPNPVPLAQEMDNINDWEGEKKAQVIEENKRLLPKKQRFRWKKEVHAKFVDAVEQLGVENAVPKKILELMNEPTLSRENVASHLQKYRKNWDKKKEEAKSMESEHENAFKSLHCSNTLPCNMNQGITDQNYQNRSMQSNVTHTNLNSFGARIREISNTMKSQAGIPLSHLQFPTMNNLVMRSYAASSHSNQHFGPKQKVDGTRFNSFLSRPIKEENKYCREYSASSGEYNHCGGPIPMARAPNSLFMLPPNSSYGLIPSTQMTQPTNSLLMLPPSSPYGQIHKPDTTHSIPMPQLASFSPMLTSDSSYAHIEMPMSDAIHSTQMAQPTNSLPMLPSSSSCDMSTNFSTTGRIQTPDATHLNHVAQPTNSLPMVLTSSSYGQLEKGNSFDFNGKEETNNFSFDTKEQSMDNSIYDLLYLDQIPFNFDENDFAATFNNNSAPSH